MIIEMIVEVLILLAFLATIVGQIYVAAKAFRRSVLDGIVCLLITWYAVYFAFKNLREVFGNSTVVRVWAVVALLLTVFLLSIPLLEGYLFSR